MSYVPVTAADRIDAISPGKADLLCEVTTITISRRKLIDISVGTFVDGAGILVTGDDPKELRAMECLTVGVLAGTTTEQALRSTLSAAGINFDVKSAATHAEGLAMLDSGRVFRRSVDPLGIAGQQQKAAQFAAADEYLTIEPYALDYQRPMMTFGSRSIARLD